MKQARWSTRVDCGCATIRQGGRFPVHRCTADSDNGVGGEVVAPGKAQVLRVGTGREG